jgi:hypothetical protein
MADVLKEKRISAVFPERFRGRLLLLAGRQRGRWDRLLRAVKDRTTTKRHLARHGLSDADLDLKYSLIFDSASRYRSMAAKVDQMDNTELALPGLKDALDDFLDVSIILLGSVLDAFRIETPLLEFLEFLRFLLQLDKEPPMR